MDKLHELLAGALRKVQFGFNFRRCPACAGFNVGPNGETDNAHRKDCPVFLALTAYDAAKANGGWLPIESAPKDGTRIIALSVDGDICCAEWRRISYGRRTRAIYGWYVPYSDHDEQGGAISLDSLLWQPLPPPPEHV